MPLHVIVHDKQEGAVSMEHGSSRQETTVCAQVRSAKRDFVTECRVADVS